ncbi:hypothetical protein H0A73_17280 [Alcaligenaceae bacterium]|nr:hypothetical protein [Alcaligenaceae bacterium]
MITPLPTGTRIYFPEGGTGVITGVNRWSSDKYEVRPDDALDDTDTGCLRRLVLLSEARVAE